MLKRALTTGAAVVLGAVEVVFGGIVEVVIGGVQFRHTQLGHSHRGWEHRNVLTYRLMSMAVSAVNECLTKCAHMRENASKTDSYTYRCTRTSCYYRRRTIDHVRCRYQKVASLTHLEVLCLACWSFCV